ncbi:O-antigen ligase family protein [Agromyces sp. MMS24-K17]|uniref:O-antigen ligase family protein n=1 Tax=Agromyces sp. MMS24-K17 TaxID=3372850 RepID=UPI0037540DFC
MESKVNGRTRTASSPTRRSGLLTLLCIAIGLSIAIPKAGVKVDGIPLTLANAGVGLLLIAALSVFLIGGRTPRNMLVPAIALMSTYFFLRLALSGANGVAVVDLAVALVVAPLLAIAVLGIVKDEAGWHRVAKWIFVAYWVVLAYAGLQLLLGSDVVAVPGFTVNLTDYQAGGSTWYLDKNNAVGSSVKLFSTYQNGNLLGVNLILLFPIAFMVARRSKLLLLLSFTIVAFLTLSRGVWLGILVTFVIMLLRRARTVRDVLARYSLMLAVLLTVPILFVVAPQVLDRFVQTDFDDWLAATGRTQSALDLVQSASTNPFTLIFGPQGIADYVGGAFEITIAAIFEAGGLIGVALITGVVLIGLQETWAGKSELSIAIFAGLVAYMITSLVEGAFWLPPTAILFWSLLGLGAAIHTAQTLDFGPTARLVSNSARLHRW